jgi:hypothetical protein
MWALVAVVVIMVMVLMAAVVVDTPYEAHIALAVEKASVKSCQLWQSWWSWL